MSGIMNISHFMCEQARSQLSSSSYVPPLDSHNQSGLSSDVERGVAMGQLGECRLQTSVLTWRFSN